MQFHKVIWLPEAVGAGDVTVTSTRRVPHLAVCSFSPLVRLPFLGAGSELLEVTLNSIHLIRAGEVTCSC